MDVCFCKIVIFFNVKRLFLVGSVLDFLLVEALNCVHLFESAHVFVFSVITGISFCCFQILRKKKKNSHLLNVIEVDFFFVLLKLGMLLCFQ